MALAPNPITYFIQDGGVTYLCVLDANKRSFNRFEVTQKNIARLTAEGANLLYSASQSQGLTDGAPSHAPNR